MFVLPWLYDLGNFNCIDIANVHFGACINYIRSEPCVLSKLELQRGKNFIIQYILPKSIQLIKQTIFCRQQVIKLNKR